MKTLVVQLWDDPETFESYHAEESSVEDFWKPCLSSVESWAGENGYDYRRYSTKECLNDLPDLEPLTRRASRPNGKTVISSWNRTCISTLAMLNNPSYDRIIRLDSDIFVWGNPPISEAPLSIYIGKRRVQDEYYQMIYPQTGAYSTTQHMDIYDWACRNIKGDEDDIFTFMRMISIFGNKSEHGFGDQKILAGWCYLNGWEEMTTHRFWRNDQTSDMTLIEPDCFIHFSDTDKLKRFQRFKAFCLYTKVDRFWDRHLTDMLSRGII